jgi:hypothetical protein
MAAHYSDRDQRLRASVVHAGYVTPVDITLVTLGEGERRFLCSRTEPRIGLKRFESAV